MCCPPDQPDEPTQPQPVQPHTADPVTRDPMLPAPAPVSRAELTPAIRKALWGLRIFAAIVTAMVAYTFITQL